MLVHQDPSHVKMYECKECNYQTKYLSSLRSHAYLHRNSSSIIFKCTKCSYRSNSKKYFQRHLLVHKDTLQMFHCNICGYVTKVERNLHNHLVVHKHPSQVEMFKCSECDFETKHRASLTSHRLVHKDVSQVKLFKCTSCNFESKYKRSFYRHIQLHEGPPPDKSVMTRVYDNESSHVDNLQHLPIHKLLHDVGKLKCEKSDFQRKDTTDIQHCSPTHQDNSESEMFTCSECSYQTVIRSDLRKHKLVHTKVNFKPCTNSTLKKHEN